MTDLEEILNDIGQSITIIFANKRQINTVAIVGDVMRVDSNIYGAEIPSLSCDITVSKSACGGVPSIGDAVIIAGQKYHISKINTAIGDDSILASLVSNGK